MPEPTNDDLRTAAAMLRDRDGAGALYTPSERANMAQKLDVAARAREGAEDKRPTALLDSDRANFDTLMDAAANDDVLLLHAREKATGHGHALICIKSIVPFHEDVDVIPVARMLDEDPTETYTNPAED